MENPHHEQMFLKGENNDKTWTNLQCKPYSKRKCSGRLSSCNYIVSNDINNAHSSVIAVIPLTSKRKKPLPTHTTIVGFGLTKTSTVLAEQITTISKDNIGNYIGEITEEIMIRIELCLLTQLGIGAKR